MKLKPDYKVRRIAGEYIVIMPGTHGVDLTRVIALNETAAWLWGQLGDRTFEPCDVAALLRERFEVDETRALRDAQEWIATLARYNAFET